jgi:hypothetical protein
MKQRDRAWRRRKTRHIIGKIRDTKNWLVSQFQNPEVGERPKEERKRHRPGKLTRVQNLRQSWKLNQEMVDGI